MIETAIREEDAYYAEACMYVVEPYKSEKMKELVKKCIILSKKFKDETNLQGTSLETYLHINNYHLDIDIVELINDNNNFSSYARKCAFKLIIDNFKEQDEESQLKIISLMRKQFERETEFSTMKIIDEFLLSADVDHGKSTRRTEVLQKHYNDPNRKFPANMEAVLKELARDGNYD